jgi:signal transduction histidine kinase
LLALLAVGIAALRPSDLAVVAFALGVAALAWAASALAAGDLVPGRAELVAFLRRRPDAPSSTGALRPPGPIGDLVESVVALAHRLEEWVGRYRTARHRAEEHERLESEFLTTVSHELRTPLNAILGFSQVLLDEIDGPLDESQREDVATIKEAGEHLRSLVDDVLDLARIEGGVFTLDRRAVDVSSVVREVARLLEAQRDDKPVTIEARVQAALPEAFGDPKRLRQIVMNLATNALAFTDEGRVTIEATAGDGAVRIAVSDTGSGIPRDALSTIFDEFHQVPSVRRVSQGSGLGLAICKRLVDLHGGRIAVESIVGHGSVFTVSLPVWRDR